MQAKQQGCRAVASALIAILTLGLLTWQPGLAAEQPSRQRAADIALGPADLGQEFTLASRGEQAQGNLSWCTQNLTRTGTRLQLIEPDGIQFVRSIANVLGDTRSAERELDRAAEQLFQGAEQVPVDNLGDQTRAAVVWGAGPFDPARRVVIFRVNRVVGAVVATSYEAPDNLDEVLRLAGIMARRAGA